MSKLAPIRLPETSPFDWLRSMPAANDNVPSAPKPTPLIPTALLRWGSIVGVALSIPSDSPSRAPIRSPHTFRIPIGIDRFGKTIQQTYSEYEDAVRMMGEILSIEMQIAEQSRLGNVHEIDRLKTQLQQLHDQTHFISASHPNMGRLLKVISMAGGSIGGGGRTESTASRFMDDFIDAETILTAEQKQDQLAMAERVRQGEATEFDFARLAWEQLEYDFLTRISAMGFEVDFFDTQAGPIYTIQQGNTDMHRQLDITQLAFSRIIPHFNHYFVNHINDGLFILPTVDYLLNTHPPLRWNLRFLTGNLNSDIFHDHHEQGLSPIQATPRLDVWLDDVQSNVHGFVMLLHDVWHTLMWDGSSPEIKDFSIYLYPIVKRIMRRYPEHLQTYFEQLIETIVQPPLEQGANAARMVQQCVGILDPMIYTVSLGLAPKAKDGLDYPSLSDTDQTQLTEMLQHVRSAIIDAGTSNFRRLSSALTAHIASIPLGQLALFTSEAHQLQNSAASESDLGFLAWDFLEDAFLHEMKIHGGSIRTIPTDKGPVYGIDIAAGTKLHREVGILQDPYSRIIPAFKALCDDLVPVNVVGDNTFQLIPSKEYILNTFPRLSAKLRFAVGNLSADDFHHHHSNGNSPVQVDLRRSVYLDDIKGNAHGYTMVMHDVWHALQWEESSSDVQGMSTYLYPRLKAVLREYPTHLQRMLDPAIELIVQPSLIAGAEAFEMIRAAINYVEQALIRAKYGIVKQTTENGRSQFEFLTDADTSQLIELLDRIKTVLRSAR
ncbi:MAG: hypothetical protein COV45_00485 [Deltaproteobacteria bacterium CG11_big_fil_rev_8_21_14_0_20_47_16]|nr:MAG: hypothetical protein COV45_00485 [Deltaproteobacteria bacterium CG11_big_fil_rev_8_21_14_0_20_47_16]